MCEVSRDIGRQVGVLVNRVGSVTYVMVGDAHGLHLPDFGRVRAGRDRFRGLRLIHTHLMGEGLSRDDLTDLALLRLDLCLMTHATASGLPGEGEYAHLLPPNQIGEHWKIESFRSVHEIGVDFQQFIRELEGEFRRSVGGQAADTREKAIIVGVAKRGDPTAQARLDELAGLTESAGVQVIDRVLQYRSAIDPKYVMGRGKLEDVVISSMQLGADLLIFDQDLRPSQLRSIASRTDLKVLDRTQLILDIFAQRATSRAGKLQVELAQMRYIMPRLGVMTTAMSRLTGGIGGRGPGETKLEINKRRANERLTKLKRQLKKLSGQRSMRRRARERARVPVVGLVGYTNAGKSTLLNRLTNSAVMAEDRLFATLDPVSRRLRFPAEREIILTDTVGFIRALPKDLVAAFKATLEELEVADLLLHVVDASASNVEEQMAAVNQVLDDLDVSDKPLLLVANKIDAATDEQRLELTRNRRAVPISAVTGEGCERLLEAIEYALWHQQSHVGREETYDPTRRERQWTHGVVSADDLDLN